MSITVNTAPATNPPITMLSPRFIVPVSIILLAGKIVSEKFDYGAGRRVTLYVPPAPEAIVFAGDGQMISQWGVRPAARTLSRILVFIELSNRKCSHAVSALNNSTPTFRSLKSSATSFPPCFKGFLCSQGTRLYLLLPLKTEPLFTPSK
jgi:hypothetical protein